MHSLTRMALCLTHKTWVVGVLIHLMKREKTSESGLQSPMTRSKRKKLWGAKEHHWSCCYPRSKIHHTKEFGSKKSCSEYFMREDLNGSAETFCKYFTDHAVFLDPLLHEGINNSDRNDTMGNRASFMISHCLFGSKRQDTQVNQTNIL